MYRLLLAADRFRDLFYGLLYRCRLQSVGSGTRFGGPHITIVGGIGERGHGIVIGKGCKIYDFAQLVCDDASENSGIRIGDNCHLNFGCYLFGSGGLEMGDDCLLGPGVKILTGGHRYESQDRPILEQGPTFGKVKVEHNVWMGANAVILPGVRVGAGSVVAAGAVVSRDVEPFSVVGGVPARLIRHVGDE